MYNIDFFQTLMLFQTMLLFINEIELHFGLFLKVTIYKRDNGGYYMEKTPVRFYRIRIQISVETKDKFDFQAEKIKVKTYFLILY